MKANYIRVALATVLLSASLVSNAQRINTIAGNGAAGFAGDGGQATAAELNNPTGVTLDVAGNIYITDWYNNRVRMINSSGVITTVAGNGTLGYSGDGGAATSAELFWPHSSALDAAGNIYIADYNNNRVRMVNTSGIISTFAGTGTGGYNGDGIQATAAQLYDPEGVFVDAAGNVFICDRVNVRVRMVNTSGVISTVAGGGGSLGDGGPATAAQLFWPTGMAEDAGGNMYIADQEHNRVRKVNTSGIISTYAGNGYTHLQFGGYSGDSGPATAAELSWPTSIAVDSIGNVFVADSGNNCIRMINTSGIISTVAGNGVSGFFGDGGRATAAELQGTEGVALDKSGNIYMTDVYNNRVREVTNHVAAINNLSLASNPVNVYPVPNNGNFTITGLKQGQIIELYNCMGQKLNSVRTDNATMSMDISKNSNGIYLIRIQDKDGTIVTQKKIVKAE